MKYKQPLFRYLDTNGDGTGEKQAIGDYSAAPTKFYIQPPRRQVYRMTRMIIHLQDSGVIDSGRYGHGIILTKGITVGIFNDNGPIVDMTDGLPVFQNAHWPRLCYDPTPSEGGAGASHYTVRWTFERTGTIPRLRGKHNERLAVIFNDDFTGLIGHTFFTNGYIE